MQRWSATPSDGGGDAGGGTLTVRGAVAVRVDAETETTAEVSVAAPETCSLDVSGCVVTPGLVNAHHHLLQTAFRTLPQSRGVPMREWLGVMAAAYARGGHDPEL